MSKKVPNYAVSFAQRYSDPVGNWLSAFSAYTRLKMLVEDVNKLDENLRNAVPEDARWSPWNGADIVSYYSVGYVTCLEWHARSRLVDLLTFVPTSVKNDDIKQIRDSIVIDMLTENVTVAQIVGASTNISSFSAYINVFARVFTGLGVSMDPIRAIKSINPKTGEPWIDGTLLDDLENLFKYRNDLVHEISSANIGHPNIRDDWSLEEAHRNGQIVLRLMEALESAIRTAAPPMFPNLIDAEWYPVDQHEVLAVEIEKLESQIENIIRDFAEGNDDEISRWSAAKKASKLSLESEKEFIAEAAMFHSRYVYMQGPLLDAALKSRYTYLQSIVKIAGGYWDISGSEKTGSD